jgi:hypothetical protein
MATNTRRRASGGASRGDEGAAGRARYTEVHRVVPGGAPVRNPSVGLLYMFITIGYYSLTMVFARYT